MSGIVQCFYTFQIVQKSKTKFKTLLSMVSRGTLLRILVDPKPPCKFLYLLNCGAGNLGNVGHSFSSKNL